ncbi:methyl-accepting chemotaxis protein [Leptolyngbya sp. Heron Island J]|uniref:methyl-accepting chemotaxis protein n=1 Tax=Leptolyngbya sp. Heron Island J TaxID=1385935 RepID=UPI0003B990B9|nr:methyl-accepting chemotaxis protein [Leptolyngbya sp. Heron Island J]ESA32332.1 methyl-accepting chemotaxis protein [Leptolyngbya sp. Heron Island J]
MAMDVDPNSSAEPQSEVDAAEGIPTQASNSKNDRVLEGVVVKSAGNNNELENSRQQDPNLELAAQLKELAASSRQNASIAAVPNNTSAENALDNQSEPVLSYRGVQYGEGERRYAPENLTVSGGSTLLQWFYDLPVSSKQLIGLISSEVISVIGLVGVGSLLIISGARQQLLKQAEAELAVTGLQYNIKVDQMGFGFRGQSENTAIVNLAESVTNNAEVNANQRAVVREILQGEIEARNIEYSTLVGIDGKIIANAQTDRVGETFDPYGLVSRVVAERQQFKANGLVERSELQRQSVELLTDGDRALIRYVATPVFSQNQANQLVGVLIAGDVVNGKESIVESSVKAFGTGYAAVYLGDAADSFQLATSADLDEGEDEIEVDEEVYDDALLTSALQNQGEVVSQRLVEPDGEAYAMSARTLSDINGEPIGVLIRGTSEVKLQQLINRSLQIQFLIALLAILADIFLAQLLGRSIANPIKRLQKATEAFAGGERQAKADIFARDEVGQLATAFNDLTGTVLRSEGTLIDQASSQAKAAQRANQLASLTSDLRKNNLDEERLYSIAVNDVRKAIEADRVIVYRFNEDWSGDVVSESVGMGWPTALGVNIADPCFASDYVEQYRRGRVQATSNIFAAGLTECHLGQLRPFKVQANLVAPILGNDELIGLLVAHQCSGSRDWSELDISFFKQAALQVGLSVDQISLFNQKQQAQLEAEALSEERRQRQETLQMELLGLLDDVEGAARGDLTVRADVSAGEIGTVADFFNAIIESLRQIVTQVKASAVQVNSSLGSNKVAMQALAEDALQQAERTIKTLDSVETMTMAITQAADRAQQAAVVAREASQTAEVGGAAMDLTVQNILELRTTVGETAKKVKRLGESSQQISKVVSLINQIATQTNLLAINAGIEAARAGEEGQGFAAVAEEVGELAARSAAATQDIERIVDSIQRETADVVDAIESSTSQVVEGTRRVDEAKQSLARIVEVSQQIDALVQTISAATVSQVETAANVSTLMQEISLVSERTSSSSKTVSEALQQTVGVAKELELSMAAFKVDDNGVSSAP